MDTSMPKPRIPAPVRDELGNVKEDIRRLGGEVRDAASSGARHARDVVADYADTALQQGKKAIHSVEHQIENQPLAAVGIALGAGFILGALLIGARR